MKFNDKKAAIVIFILTSICLLIIQLSASGINGETDSISHYQIARYAFKYPHFFLDHWGKPLFTILSAPLAQFGYIGSIAFNLLCGLFSGWFVYLISRKLNFKYAWIAILFTVFTPMYLFIMYTSLTEILFSLVLIAAIYLFISEQFVWAAILISFIPFARTEGLMFILLFLPALMLVKRFNAIPFLFTGFIVFGLAGLPLYHDFFWFFTKMPYNSGGSALYGSGSFWFYFQNLDFILNYPLLILGITGLIYLFSGLEKIRESYRNLNFVTLYFIIIPAFFGFLLAQSFLWWQGMMGVLGSNRFMACVLPLFAIIAVAGFNWIMEKVHFNRWFQAVFLIFIIVIVVLKPFSYGLVPMRPQNNFAVMQQLTSWLKTSKYNARKAYYTDPSYPFFMNMDPFDQQKCFKQYSFENLDPASLLKAGELLIWDTQFSGFEGKLPFDSLMKNNNLRLLNIFTPIESFTVIGGEKYKLAIFLKAPRDTTRIGYKEIFLNTFEQNISDEQKPHLATGYSFSSSHSIKLDPDYIYSPEASGKLSNLPGNSNIYLKATARILNPSTSEKGKITLVLSIDDNQHKVYRYLTSNDSDIAYKPGEWFMLSFTDMIDRNMPPDGNYKVYVWYQGKEKIFVDDLKLEYMNVGD